MPSLFAFWAVDRHGRPVDPDAYDPWGERSPLDALEVDRETVGPYLTVLHEETETLVFEGDVSAALRMFAAEVAESSGWPVDPDALPVDAALAACEVIISEAGDEWAREAVYDWCEPNPDTSRNPRRMPEHVRRGIRRGAEVAGREAASEALRDHLLARVAPVRLAA